MRQAARNLEFERAAALRDEIQEIRLRVLDGDASAAVARAAERGGGGQRRDMDAAALDVAAVRVVEVTDAAEQAGEEADAHTASDSDTVSDSDTASDWLPGIRDEHEDDGWAAKWLDKPTWDHTVTPNVIKRTGARSPRRGGRRR